MAGERDPERVKRELASAFDRLLALDFDTLLFAHAIPSLGVVRRRCVGSSPLEVERRGLGGQVA